MSLTVQTFQKINFKKLINTNSQYENLISDKDLALTIPKLYDELPVEYSNQNYFIRKDENNIHMGYKYNSNIIIFSAITDSFESQKYLFNEN